MLITFTNSVGKSATFAYEAATPTLHKYLLNTFDSDSMSVNYISHYGYNQNGETYIKTLVKPRKIDLSFWIYGDTDYNQYAYLASVFSPVLGLGKLAVTTDTRTRYIDCYVSGNISEMNSQGKLKHYTVNLIAPVPYFYGDSKSVIFSNTEYGGVSFPLEFNSYVVFDFNGLCQTVQNTGDAPCPMQFTINNVAVTNPSMECVDTDEHIGIIGNLKKTDKLLIDTTYGNKKITKNGKNIVNLIDPTSTWMQLPVGRSTWRFETESQNPVLTMSWTEYFNSF